MELKVKKLNESATLPTRATQGSAGYDLYACLENATQIAPGQTVKIPTGIAIALPDNNHVALIYARSGLSVNHGIALANSVGVIDSDYRGEIIVALVNNSQIPYTIEPQTRIAQMVITPVALPQLIEVPDLEETARGSGGFGSSGTK